jgi:hypothetical protein
MPVFGTTNFGSGGPLAGTVNQVATFTSQPNLSSHTMTGVSFGTGGKLVIAVAYGPNPSVTSWTAAGNTITTRTQLTGAEVGCAIGTVDVGGTTSGTIVVNLSGTSYRILGHVWDVSNVDLTTVSSNPTADKSWSLTYGTIAANGIAVAINYDQNGGTTGATNLDYDGETAVVESAAAGAASRAFTAAQSSYAFNFDGSRHSDGSGVAGLALPNG